MNVVSNPRISAPVSRQDLDGTRFIQSEQTDLNSSHKRLTGVDVDVFCKRAEQNSDTICFITGKLALLPNVLCVSLTSRSLVHGILH